MHCFLRFLLRIQTGQHGFDDQDENTWISTKHEKLQEDRDDMFEHLWNSAMQDKDHVKVSIQDFDWEN